MRVRRVVVFHYLAMKFLLLLFCVRFAYSYNILGIFTHPMFSHHATFDPLMVELARRGHNVTHVHTFPKNYQILNYHEVNIKPCFKLPEILELDMMKSLSSFFGATHTILNFNPSYEEVSTCKPLIELLNTTQKFDVLITEMFTTDFFVLYANKLNLPVIGYHSNLPYTWHAERLGMPYNPSYIPATLAGLPPKMNFVERFMNVLANLYSLFAYEKYSQQVFNEMVYKFYGPGMPLLQDAIKNTSLMFFYSFFAYSAVRPLVPNAIEVGGLHIKQSQPLPEVRIFGEFIYFFSKSWCEGMFVIKYFLNIFQTSYVHVFRDDSRSKKIVDLLGTIINFLEKNYQFKKNSSTF